MEKELEDYLTTKVIENKNKLENFFDNPNVKEYLNQNQFSKIYGQYIIRYSVLTSLFLLCDINFLLYMSYIPYECFKEIPIRSIIIPNNIKKIDAFAFSYCSNLKNVTLPKSIDRLE